MLEATLSNQHLDQESTSELVGRLEECRQFPAGIEIPLAGDPIRWLRSQADTMRIVWSERTSGTPIVGCGVAAEIQGKPGDSPNATFRRVRQLIGSDANLRCFGGFSFHNELARDAVEWSAFGTARFWLPRFTFDGRSLRIAVLDEQDRAAALDMVRGLRRERPPAAWRDPEFLDRQDSPDRQQWTDNVRQSLRMFEQEVLEKIVLARRTTLRFAQPIDSLALTERLIEATPACFHFCFQLSDRHAFMGATPERLFLRQGQDVYSEAVAGTRPRGETEADDSRLRNELLASIKDQLEHDIVRKSIRQRLHGCVEELHVDCQANVLQLARKQHLVSRIHGRVKPQVQDGELLARLHPTPAVGGYPTENAIAEIDRLEPFERGWYAAPIGWIAHDSAEFAVAIRSGMLFGNTLSLYSGAGIVPGSTAESEWNEIEHKISDFLEILDSA